MDDFSLQNLNENKKKKSWLVKNLFLIIIAFCLIIYYTMFAPLNNVKDTVIHIASGQSINLVSQELKNKNAIRSEFVLKAFVKFLKSGKGLVSGDYLIEKKTPVWKIAWQISRGHHNMNPIKITIREGLSNEEIASLLADKLAGFRKDLFLSGGDGKQGYLFPDTYFFFPLDTADEIIKKLSDNFDNKIKGVSSEIKNGKSMKDIIIMASILEGEVNGEEDVRIISGILWKRISLGMPLQVDVDKSTYTEKGLPDEPINNPGLVTIKAAINPESSPYLYYLHDDDGVVHFAKSFEEHKLNIKKYLK